MAMTLAMAVAMPSTLLIPLATFMAVPMTHVTEQHQPYLGKRWKGVNK